MPGGLFTCEVAYLGRRAVQGAQSSATLTALVDNLLRPHPPIHTQPIHTHNYVKQRRSERCQLVCDDEHIRVTPVRKDEGFESDTESSGSACDDPYCGTQDIKVISDHVMRLDQLISEDGNGPSSFLPTSSDEASSSATSSGAESEDDSPRTAAPTRQAPSVAQEVVGSRSGGGVGDLFLMSDILYCHVSTATPRVLVVVVKDAGSSQVYAHAFQCHTEDTARNLYAHYKEASNKYKLNRYRNSKRKTQMEALGLSSSQRNSNSSSSSSSGGGNKKAVSGKPPSGRGLLASGSRGSLRGGEARPYAPDRQGDNDKNVNVIQIRESEAGGEDPSPWNLVQHTDANGVTHIEIDSGPCSLQAGTSGEPSDLGLASLAITHPGQLSSSLSSVATRSHSRNNSLNSITGGESLLGGGSSSSSCPSSLVSTGREVLVGGELDKRSRQRQPPLLLRREGISYEDQGRRSDERRNEDSLRRGEAKKKARNEWREDEIGRSRRDWHEGERTVGLQEVLRPTVEAMIPRLPQERQSRTREHSRARARASHNKGPAPPPPPRRHPENPALLLVPTKSGAETARAFYPKESHIVRGNKVVRVEAGGYGAGPWGCHDLNNNPNQYGYYGGWAGPHEYHAPRSRDNAAITPEMRRRSRSKSPARRPMAHRYIDAVSTFSLSQKLKDISEAVFTARRNAAAVASGSGQATGFVKGHQRSHSSMSGGDGEGTLRPVIKKGRRQESSPQPRRVTFSAYATVQVMEA